MKLTGPGPAVISIVVGLTAGALVSRALHPSVTVAATLAPAKVAERPQIAAPALLPSSDTVETLKDTDLPNRAGRLAIWLPHADLPEIQSFWDYLITSKPLSDDLVTLVLARWVVLDPQGAIAANRKLGNSATAWEAWAAWDPKAAEAAARATGDPRVLPMVLQAIAGRDPDYVLKLIAQDVVRGNTTLSKVLEGFIAQRRYDKALDAILRYGGYSSNREEIFREWSRDDPEQALLWGARNPNVLGAIGVEALGAIVREHADKMPAILAQMPTGLIKSRARHGYTLALAEKDPAAAVRFAEGMESPLIRASLLASVGKKLSASQPAVAAEILGKVLDSGRVLDEYPVAVFFLEGQREGWHSTDSPFPEFAEDLVKNMPEQAMDAVMASADKPAYQAAARQLAGDWMEKDEWDFGGWLKRQPGGEMRDELVMKFSSQLARGENPAYDQALNLVSSVADARQRDHQLDRLLLTWKSRNPEALRSYLAASGTPEIIRSRAKQFDQE